MLGLDIELKEGRWIGSKREVFLIVRQSSEQYYIEIDPPSFPR